MRLLVTAVGALQEACPSLCITPGHHVVKKTQLSNNKSYDSHTPTIHHTVHNDNNNNKLTDLDLKDEL